MMINLFINGIFSFIGYRKRKPLSQNAGV